jgi:hypothetical protein
MQEHLGGGCLHKTCSFISFSNMMVSYLDMAIAMRMLGVDFDVMFCRFSNVRSRRLGAMARKAFIYCAGRDFTQLHLPVSSQSLYGLGNSKGSLFP